MTEIRYIQTPIFGTYTPQNNPEGIATLYSCVRLISNTIASTQLIHINNQKEEQTQSDISRLLKSPQRDTTLYSWLNSMVRDYVLHGNSYSLIVEDELIYLPNNQVQVFTTDIKEAPFHYQVSLYGENFVIYPEEMIHLKNISLDGYVGISPLQLHRQTFDASFSMQAYTAKFIENTNTLSGVLKSQRKLTKEALEDLRIGFNNRHQGSNNAGKTAILPEGIDFHPLKPVSSADLDFINNFKLNKAQIAEIFQVPLSMLGTADLSYNNAESNALNFQNFTINPILRNIEQELTLKLLPERSNDRIIFLVDTLSLASSKEKADSLSLLVNTGIFTPNEARKKYGLTSHTEGDILRSQKEPPREPTPEGTNTPPSKVKPPSKRSKNGA